MTRLLVAWIVWHTAWLVLVATTLLVGLKVGSTGEAITWTLLSILVGLVFMIPLDRVQKQVLGDDH